MELFGIFHIKALVYDQSKHLFIKLNIIRHKCEVECKTIQLNRVSEKNKITIRTTRYSAWKS